MPSLVNIDSKGYGRIYKFVIRNKKLPLLAKAIYAYFCSYAGNGCKAFPKRDKITKDLGMNKDTLTKHLNRLVVDGYIAKERTKAGNTYTIMQSVHAYNTVPEDHNEAMTDMLVMENVSAKGYGVVPKLVMLDTTLTAQAKAIYAYFASFSGAGTTAFPRRTTVMRELGISSTNTYYKRLDLLVESGYLTIKQDRTGGRFDVCTYRLNCCVEPGTPPHRDWKATTQKVRHGQKATSMPNFSPNGQVRDEMSEKVHPGGEVEKANSSTTPKVISEKVSHEETVSQYPGHPYKNNNITTRNSYFMTEQENNHQPYSHPMAVERFTQFSSDDIKRHINFDHLQDEADGWGQLLKNTLGSLDTPEEEARYHQTMDEILMEIVNQLTEQLNKAKEPDSVIAVLKSEAFTMMFEDILARWDEIRNVRAYIEASLKNLIERGRGR